MFCDHCAYRNSWDCGDGWNRRSNCDGFKLDWNTLSDSEADAIRSAIRSTLNNKTSLEFVYENEGDY